MRASLLRRLVPRYSLRTLAIFLMLVTSGMGLWWRWEPWQCHWSITEREGIASAVFVSPDDRLLVSVSGRGVREVWHLESGHPLFSLEDPGGVITSVAFSPDSSQILTACDDGTVRIWNVATGRVAATADERVRDANYVQFSSDGRYIAACGGGRRVYVWTAKGTSHFYYQSMRNMEGFTISPDARGIIFFGAMTTSLCDLETGYERTEIRDGYVHSAAFSPDSKRVVTVGEECLVRVWDAASGDELMVLANDKGKCDYVAWSPDGRHIAARSMTAWGLLWDLEQGPGAAKVLAPMDWEDALRFSPDGRWLLSMNYDGKARIWACETGRCVAILTGGKEKLHDAVFTNDGERIVTAGADGVLRVWRQRRPYEWWGVFWLWEFWLAAALAALFVWSIARDRRALAARAK